MCYSNVNANKAKYLKPLKLIRSKREKIVAYFANYCKKLIKEVWN